MPWNYGQVTYIVAESVGPDDWRWFKTRTNDPSRHPARGMNRRDPLLMRQQQ
jgi:hypothetical protein